MPEPASSAARRKLGIGGWICAAWIGFLVLVSLVAPMLTAEPVTENGRVVEGCGTGEGLPLYDPLKCSDLDATREQRRTGQAVGEFKHLTGVDKSGGDVFSATVIGTRTTLIIAFSSIALAALLGGAMGLVSGYLGGKIDMIFSGLFDVMIAFPPLILALLIVNTYAAIPEDPKLAEEAINRRVPGIILALVVVATPILGRITRASTLTWAGREFVMAAKALGARPLRIMLREVLPNVVPALMSIALLAVGVVVVTESSLSLIGLGVPDGDTSWGTVIASGAADLRRYPHQVFVPSIAVILTICALNFLGDALRRKFDVRESAL
ncbi:MAG: ABC transporter permease [Microthrixaceae bacterium]|nr:ABC transporter permease [Microthrixaceae bacterium]